jgi:hypothetical protein
MKKIFCLLCFLLQFAILYSCSEPNFRPLEPNRKTDVVIEGRYWRGLFARKGGFELRLINNSSHDCKNCVLILDGKYKHTVDGLYSVEKGLLKDSVFRKGDNFTLKFTGDISNMYFFNPDAEGFIPKTVGLTCDSCDVEWQMK